MAKIMEPETGQPTEPAKGGQLASEKYINLIDAAATGAMNGLQMMGGIGAMLLAFIALIAMVNGMLEAGGAWLGIEQLTLERVLGGLGAVAPSRRDEISRYGFRALLAASLSNLLSAALAGFFLTLSGV